MEERKFTLRITKAQTEKLIKLRNLTGCNTDTKTIRFIINNYEDLNNLYLAEKRENEKLKIKNGALESKINNFISAFKNLQV